MSGHLSVRIVVDPTPTDAEAAAITAAASMSISAEADLSQEDTRKNVWREAGKREALRESQWETRT